MRMALDLRVQKSAAMTTPESSSSSSDDDDSNNSASAAPITSIPAPLSLTIPHPHTSLPTAAGLSLGGGGGAQQQPGLYLPSDFSALAAMSFMGGLQGAFPAPPPHLPALTAAHLSPSAAALLESFVPTSSRSLGADVAITNEHVAKELERLKEHWGKERTISAATASVSSQSSTNKLDNVSQTVGWTSIGDVIVPYIMRGDCKYVSVRVVEAKLLASLHGVNLDKMSHAGPLYSYYVTEQEAAIFSEINSRCYNHQFGSKPFTTHDLIVSLAEFERFYNNLKKQCSPVANTNIHMGSQNLYPGISRGRGRKIDKDSCHISTPSIGKEANSGSSTEGVEGGWVQINNTVIPYVFRNGVKFVPLSVIKRAAGLLTDVRIDGYKAPCTLAEHAFLNSACSGVGVDYEFIKNTNLIKLELVIRMSNCKVTIKELPKDNPFSQAMFQHHVREAIQVYPVSSSPDSNQQQNPAVFQISCAPQVSSTPETFAAGMFTPVTSIAHHSGVPFYNGSRVGIEPVRSISPTGPSMHSRNNGHGGGLEVSHLHNYHLQSSSGGGGEILDNPTKKLFTKSKSSKIAKGLHRSLMHHANTMGHPNKIVIECVDFEGKTLPCLQRGGIPENSFVLVESVMRLYFPQTTLEQFMDILQGVMDVTIIHLRSVEEQAFIRFYNLPVKAMRYKFMMMFIDLQRCFADLKSYFSIGTINKEPVSPPPQSAISTKEYCGSLSRQQDTDIIKNPSSVTSEQGDKSLPIPIVEAGESPVCFVVNKEVVESLADVNSDEKTEEFNADGERDMDTEENVLDNTEERQALLGAVVGVEDLAEAEQNGKHENNDNYDNCDAVKDLEEEKCPNDTDKAEPKKSDSLEEAEEAPLVIDTDSAEQNAKEDEAKENIALPSSREAKSNCELAGSDAKDECVIISKQPGEGVETVRNGSPTKRSADTSEDVPHAGDKKAKFGGSQNNKKLESALEKLKQLQRDKLCCDDEG